MYSYFHRGIIVFSLQIADLARHPEGSPGYTKAVINLLLHMKEKGVDINEMGVNGVGFTVFIGYCDYHLVTRTSDITTIFPIPKANFSTVALLPCDYLLVYLLDIVTILPSSRGSHNISFLL